MSKAHKAILDSLRQKPPRQPRGVQTKGIQSFEVRDDLCRDDGQPSPPRGAGAASQLCYPKQTAAGRMLEGPTLIYTLSRPPPCAGKSSCQRGRGSWKIARVFSRSHYSNLGSVSRAGRAVPLQHHPQPASAVWDADRRLALGPKLGSQPN